MDIFSQFSVWLDAVLPGISDNFWLSMVFIFLVSIGECVFLLGLFVPSTPVLLLTGSLMAVGKLPFWPIYLVAVLGAVIGDTISYWIGRLLEHRIKDIWPFSNYLSQIAKGEEFFKRHGGKSVFIGRFIPGVKAVVPGVARAVHVARMPRGIGARVGVKETVTSPRPQAERFCSISGVCRWTPPTPYGDIAPMTSAPSRWGLSDLPAPLVPEAATTVMSAARRTPAASPGASASETAVG